MRSVLLGTAVFIGDGIKKAELPYQKLAEELREQHSSTTTTQEIFVTDILDLFFLPKEETWICKGSFIATTGPGIVTVAPTEILPLEEGCWCSRMTWQHGSSDSRDQQCREDNMKLDNGIKSR
jgi:hypothetical protein